MCASQASWEVAGVLSRPTRLHMGAPHNLSVGRGVGCMARGLGVPITWVNLVGEASKGAHGMAAPLVELY